VRRQRTLGEIALRRRAGSCNAASIHATSMSLNHKRFHRYAANLVQSRPGGEVEARMGRATESADNKA